MLQDAIISGCLELISDEASIIDDVTGMSYWVDCPTDKALEKESFDIRVENTRLKEENEILKQKMDALLTFIKDHKEG